MRSRFVLNLYSDVEVENEISDMLYSMPKSRRAEVIRMMIKLGYQAMNPSKNLKHSYEAPKPKDEESTAFDRAQVDLRKEKKQKEVRKHNNEKLDKELPPKKEIASQTKHHEISTQERESESENVLENEHVNEQANELALEVKKVEIDSNNDASEVSDPLENMNSLFKGI